MPKFDCLLEYVPCTLPAGLMLIWNCLNHSWLNKLSFSKGLLIFPEQGILAAFYLCYGALCTNLGCYTGVADRGTGGLIERWQGKDIWPCMSEYKHLLYFIYKEVWDVINGHLCENTTKHFLIFFPLCSADLEMILGIL